MIKHRKQIRLKHFDYSKSGYYYITICTKNRLCIFGNIFNGKIVLNDIGKIVDNILNSLPRRYKQIKLDMYQIMPNHIHMIMIIQLYVEAGLSRLTTLGQIIGYFKYQSTIQINDLLGSENPTPTIKKPTTTIKKIFQRNYYEHIIRNEIELNKIRGYIKTNPLFWNQDVNYQQ